MFTKTEELINQLQEIINTLKKIKDIFPDITQRDNGFYSKNIKEMNRCSFTSRNNGIIAAPFTIIDNIRISSSYEIYLGSLDEYSFDVNPFLDEYLLKCSNEVNESIL